MSTLLLGNEDQENPSFLPPPEPPPVEETLQLNALTPDEAAALPPLDTTVHDDYGLLRRPIGEGALWEGTLDATTAALFDDPREIQAQMANAVYLSREEAVPLAVMVPLLPFYQQEYSQRLHGEDFKSPVHFLEKTFQPITAGQAEEIARTPAQRVERKVTELRDIAAQPGYGIESPELSPDGLSLATRQKQIDELKAAPSAFPAFDQDLVFTPGFPRPTPLGQLEARQRLHESRTEQWRADLITPQNIKQRAIAEVGVHENQIDQVIGNRVFQSWARDYHQVEANPFSPLLIGKANPLTDSSVRRLAEEYLLTRPGSGDILWDALARTGKGALANVGGGASGGLGVAFQTAGFESIGQAMRDVADWSQMEARNSTDRRQDGTVPAVVSEGLGELAAYTLTGSAVAGLTRAAGAGERGIALATTLATGTLGGAENAHYLYQEAKTHGATEENARLAAGWGFVGGTTTSIPVTQWALRVERGSQTFIPVSRMAVETLEASLQSGGQQLTNNAIAQQIFDQNRDSLEGVVGAAAVGMGTGTILSFLTSVAAKARGSRATPSNSPYRNPDGTLILPDNWPVPKNAAEATALANFLKLVNDPIAADQAYNLIPDSFGGKVVGTDASRELFMEYRDREGKIRFTDITTIPASLYAKDRIWREIVSLKEGNRLLFTAGGVGAGKSRLLARIINQYDLVFDSTFRDSRWLESIFNEALTRHWIISVVYRQRPINQVAEGVIERADETGRTFPLRNLFDSHREAQQSVLVLSHQFEDSEDVNFEFNFTNGGEIAKINISDIDKGGSLNYEAKINQRGKKATSDTRVKDSYGSTEADSRRGIKEAFEQAIRKGEVEDRILRLLARKDAGLEKILAEYGIAPISEGEIDLSPHSVYDKVINANLTSIGKYLADQSRAFGKAAEKADTGRGQESGEGTSQASPGRALAAWARQNDQLINEASFDAFTLVSESTSEHIVYYRESDDRVVKRTKDLYYGQVPGIQEGRLVSESASPSEYLRRMALQTAVFHSDIRLEGITVPKDSLFLDNPPDAPFIVTSQPWFESAGPVTFYDIEQLLSHEGFRPVPNSFYGWVREADGVVILDASPDNFILTSEGLVPIDLQMNVFTPEQLRETGLIR